jgi:hypothetical protein
MPICSCDTLAWARFYVDLGLCPIPAAYGEKRPSINWRAYQTQKPGEEEIERWFNRGQVNVAIICGQVSNNLVVLDFDDPAVYHEFCNAAKLEAKVPVVETGRGGRHVWLRTPRPVPSFKIPELKLEIRSNGNIVIAPPSLHPCGRCYRFVNGIPWDIPVVKNLVEEIHRVARERFGIEFSTTDPREFKRKASEKPWRGRHPPCIRKLLEGVNQGFRNEAALRLAGYLLFVRDLESCKVLEILKCWNRRNRPALPGRELERVLKNTLHGGYTFGCRGLAAFCNPEQCSFMRRRERYWSPSRWSWRLGNGLP